MAAQQKTARQARERLLLRASTTLGVAVADIVPPAAPGAQPTTPYKCPGIHLPSQATETFSGYVACYRAGHHCPPKVAIRKDDEHGRHTTWRCPCCGDFGGSTFMPHEWFDDGGAA